MVLLPLVLALSPWGHAAAGPSEPTVTDRPALPSDPEPGEDPLDGEGEDPDDGSSLRDELPEEQRLAEAGAAFARGVDAYKAGRFEQAQQHFAEAQRLAPHPDTLFNLGLAQQGAEDHVAAWRSFDRLLADTADEREREDIVAAQAASRPHVSWLRVRTNVEGIVCLDGRPMPTDDDGTPSVLTTPGAHRLDVDREYRPIELEGGERWTVELELAAAQPPPPPRRTLRVLTGMSIVGTAAATGLGLSAALVEPSEVRLGLGLGAAFTGTLALTSTIIALAVHRRTRLWRPPPPLRQCPP